MTNKTTLPRLWLYITFCIVLTIFSLVSCTKDAQDGRPNNSPEENNQDKNHTEFVITFAPGSYAQGTKFTLTKKAETPLMLEGADFQRHGFTLVGWQEVEGEDQYYPIGSEFTKDEPVTLYPVWRINTYEVVFSPGEYGVGAQVNAVKVHATPLVLPSHVFTREGYTQIGWSIVENGEKVFGLSGEYVDDRAITFYPVWERNTYTLTLDPGKSASGDKQIIDVKYGLTYKLSEDVYSRKDYNLVGWSIEDGGAALYTADELIVVKGDMTLYPVWELTETYNVTLDYKKLPKTLMTTMNVADLALYYKLVNAFLNFETSVSYTSDTNPELVLEILHCYFPVMYANIDENGPWIDAEDNTINFSYITADVDNHNEKILVFADAVGALLSDFNRTDTEVERALLIYQRLQQRVAYDSEFGIQTRYNSSAYYAILFGLGRSDTFSNAYAFLLTQADVDAVVVSSLHKTDGAEHYWVALMLDFKWYYADFTLDLEAKGLTHFGITDTEMIALEYENAENKAITAYTGKGIKELVDTLDTRFHVFHNGAYSPVLDRENNVVTFKDVNGNENSFSTI